MSQAPKYFFPPLSWTPLQLAAAGPARPPPWGEWIVCVQADRVLVWSLIHCCYVPAVFCQSHPPPILQSNEVGGPRGLPLDQAFGKAQCQHCSNVCVGEPTTPPGVLEASFPGGKRFLPSPPPSAQGGVRASGAGGAAAPRHPPHPRHPNAGGRHPRRPRRAPRRGKAGAFLDAEGIPPPRGGGTARQLVSSQHPTLFINCHEFQRLDGVHRHPPPLPGPKGGAKEDPRNGAMSRPSTGHPRPFPERFRLKSSHSGLLFIWNVSIKIQKLHFFPASMT